MKKGRKRMDIVLQKSILGLFICPLIMLIAGLLTWRIPPRKINPIYGFRTKRASKSQESWEYANKLAARLFIVMSVIGVLFCIVMFLIVLNAPLDTRYNTYRTVVFVNLGLFCMQLVSLITIVEVKLKRKGF